MIETSRWDVICSSSFLEYRFIRAVDPIKDQSFFLCHLNESILPWIEFPIGHLMKSEVKRLASELDLEKIAKKDESRTKELLDQHESRFLSGMGLCFIGKRKFSRFISQYISDQIGLVRSIETNEILGEHRGLHRYTVGQRIVPINEKYRPTKPLYIVKKDLMENLIYAVRRSDHWI